MPLRLAKRITLPTAGVSVLLLLVGVSGAWYVDRLQRLNSQILDFNVTSIRASEELEIVVRQLRHELDRFLLTENPDHLARALGMEVAVRDWLADAQEHSVSTEERALAAKMTQGLDTFFTRLRAVAGQPDQVTAAKTVESLAEEVLGKNVLTYAHQYLELNEQQLQHSSQQNKAMADRLAVALLLLGTCGAVAGLVAGYGVARGISRAIYQLSVPIRDVAGKLTEVVGPISVSGDPSVKDLEVVLQRLAAQVGSVVEQLHARHQEVIRADQLAAVGQLAAGLAHELRNPLMCMKVLVQSATRHGASAKLDARDLAVLDEELARLENLVQAFLDFARPAKLEKKDVDLVSILRQTVEFLSGQAERRNVEVGCQWPSGPLLVEADPAQLRQVFLNLLVNALDAVRSGGRIWVEAAADEPDAGAVDSGRAAERRLRVRIADNGRGLPTNDRRRIYEPFFSTKETGLGLGLAISQRIVRAHGGEIGESDREGGGAVFEVVFPSQPGPAHDPPRASCPSEELGVLADLGRGT